MRVELFGDEVEQIKEMNSLTGEIYGLRNHVSVFPASHYVTSKEKMELAIQSIEAELEERVKWFKDQGKLVEAQRLEQRTRYDLELLREIGSCKGIENYSRHINGLPPGAQPYTLIDYFPDDFLIIVDESHVMLPQLRGMWAGDRSRKVNLVDYGFRLPSALDNRPLSFEEFEAKVNQIIYVSATPGDYEKEKSGGIVAGRSYVHRTLDPEITMIKTGQIDDLIAKSARRWNERREFSCHLTKKMASNGLFEKCRYKSPLPSLGNRYPGEDGNHSRPAAGVFDVLVGISLLRGLDLPEVSLVAILDADKEGFLRTETSLIQTCGRAARNVRGRVIMYADRVSDAMDKAIAETRRRREIQEAYNKEHGIVPKTVEKSIRDVIEATKAAEEPEEYYHGKSPLELTKKELADYIKLLEKQMKQAAADLQFERAAQLRDRIFEYKVRL